MKVSFIKSATGIHDSPQSDRPEIGVIGRSNGGKSSFINTLTNKLIAKVGSSPGKTRLLNFFNIGDYYCLVDMPGYGYAKRSGKELNSWQSMIESYIFKRENLVGLVLIMDIRRKWAVEEQMILESLVQAKIPLVVVLSKADKLSRSQQLSSRLKIIKESGVSQVFNISYLRKTGVKEVEEYIFNNWVKK